MYVQVLCTLENTLTAHLYIDSLTCNNKHRLTTEIPGPMAMLSSLAASYRAALVIQTSTPRAHSTMYIRNTVPS